MPPWILDELGRPTPLGSAVFGLDFVAGLLIIGLIGALLRGRRKKQDDQNGLFSRARRALGSADRAVMHPGAWVAGTRYRRHGIRLVHVPVTFLGLTATSTFAPWPWGIVVIMLGMVVILGVFRHWSRNENEMPENVDASMRYTGCRTREPDEISI